VTPVIAYIAKSPLRVVGNREGRRTVDPRSLVITSQPFATVGPKRILDACDWKQNDIDGIT
jgi:hypothetical protein